MPPISHPSPFVDSPTFPTSNRSPSRRSRHRHTASNNASSNTAGTTRSTNNNNNNGNNRHMRRSQFASSANAPGIREGGGAGGDDDASSGSSDWHASQAGGDDSSSDDGSHSGALAVSPAEAEAAMSRGHIMAARSREHDDDDSDEDDDYVYDYPSSGREEAMASVRVGLPRVESSLPPPPPRNPHPEDMEDPIVRRASAANARTSAAGTSSVPNATKRAGSKSLNDTLHTSAETDDADDDGDAFFAASPSSSSALDRVSSRIVGAIASSMGYEMALTQRGSTGVAVPELCGDENQWDHEETSGDGDGSGRGGGGGDKKTRWETIGSGGGNGGGGGGGKSPRESLCTKKIILLAFILLIALGAVGAGVGYLLSSKKSTSSSDSSAAPGVSSNGGSEASGEADDFPGSSSVDAPTGDTTDQEGYEAEATDDPTLLPTAFPTFLPTTPEPTSAPTFRPTTEAERTYKTFSFVVFGDIPYSEEEAAYLEAQLYQLGIDADGNPNIDDLFAVHVGDIMGGSDSQSNPCNRDEYRFVEEILTKVSPIPIFLQVGDNDWTECEDPDEGWRYWKESFFDLDKNWAAHQNLTYSASTSGGLSGAQLSRMDVPTIMSPSEFTGMVQRQDKRKENFVFMHERVLFLGINMIFDVFSTTEREDRMEDNKEFVREQLALRSDMKLRAVILFGHAWYDNFFDELKEELTVGLDGTPVVYFHGNGHEWYFDDEYYGVDNPFYVMQVDNGAVAPPLKITVYGDDRSYLDEEERKDASDELIDGFIGVDRQGGTDQGHHIYVGAGAPFLITLGGEICTEDEPCGMCEGDCDSDDDCGLGLICIERDEFESVPGCDDPIVNLEGWDFCARS